MALQVRDSTYFFSVLGIRMLFAPTALTVFDQFAEIEQHLGKNEGDTIVLNRYPHLGDVGLTLAARAVGEAATIGISSPVNVTPEQAILVLTDYWGPHNGTAVAPYGISEATARRANAKLIEYSDPLSFVNSIGGAFLDTDHKRWHDRVLCNLCLTTTQIRNPAGKADASTLVTDKVTTADILAIRKTLIDNNVPTFDDGTYVAVISSQVEHNLLSDADFKAAAINNANAGDRIWMGEIGKYLGVRFVTSTNIPTTTVNSLTAAQYVVFGKQAFGYGVGSLPEIRKNANDDYGRFLYLVWKCVRAYAVLNSSFIVKGRSFAL